MPSRPLVSFILATHNRAGILLETLQRVRAAVATGPAYEIHVVDNASSDGTAERLAGMPDVRVHALSRNRGSCAKALAVPSAAGEFVVFLDDDSHPLGDSVHRLIRHFEALPRLGAAGFTVNLPDGRQESAAFPGVFVGCGVGFRRRVLNRVGGLDPTYFMQGEEYDLCFRLLRAGYDIRVFDDLRVLHLKTAAARQPRRTVYYDVRNNLSLAAQYFPNPWYGEYSRDWTQRYAWLAGDTGALVEFQAGRRSGRLRGMLRRLSRARRRLSPALLRQFIGWESICDVVRQITAGGGRQVLFADLGKNIYPYYLASRQAGLQVAGVMDDRFAGGGRHYRGVPLVTFSQGLARGADAVVISNSSPVQAAATRKRLQGLTEIPLYDALGHRTVACAAPVT